MSHTGQRPQWDARHAAMLAEMGINVWWGEAAAAPVPVASPVEDGVRARAADTRPAAPPPPVRPRPPQAAAAVGTPAAGGAASVCGLDRPALEAVIRDCTACDLGRLRQQAVPGMGDPSPDWLVIGEAPGEEEDRQGLPFVGRAGQLLDRMLAAMHLGREQKVYITNVIKCRPPHNRNPDPVEIAQCAPYLLRQVELLRPRIILAMGRFAAQTVLAQGERFDAAALQQMPLGKLRGQVHQVTLGGQTLPVVVTYHPAYLLRSPAEKGKAWADLCLAMETLDALRR